MAQKTQIVVTIDGPSGSGKSTVAREVARRLSYRLLDSGAIYRAIALTALEHKVHLDDQENLAEIARQIKISLQPLLDGSQRVLIGERDVTRDIREPEVSSAASKISAHEKVRTALMPLQRAQSAGGGLVCEGRDMGTVIFPGAEAKFFLTATMEERSRRRFEELRACGNSTVTLESVLKDQKERDERDSSRAVAPLKPAQNAIVIDSTNIPFSLVVDIIASLAMAKEFNKAAW